MEIVYDVTRLREVVAELQGALEREGETASARPVLVDKFLEDAVEVDVDAVRDATGEIYIGGIMEHVEEAGIHSGDSACAIPPPTLAGAVVKVIEDYTAQMADALSVVGLINVQYAVKDGTVYVLEANPRASRTVPFVSKATGVPLAKLAARVMLGESLRTLREAGVYTPYGVLEYTSVKEAVLPFTRFPGVDSLLGPEMRSTGEVMGIGRSFGVAFAKSQIAASSRLPENGAVFMSLADRDKEAGLSVARSLVDLGFSLAATGGTAAYLESGGVGVAMTVAKLGEEGGPDNAVDLIAGDRIQLVINTPREGRRPKADGQYIRNAAIAHRVPCITTMAAARAAVRAMGDYAARGGIEVVSLQDLHG